VTSSVVLYSKTFVPSLKVVNLVSSDDLEDAILLALSSGTPCKTPKDLFSMVRCYYPDVGFPKIRYALKSLLEKGFITYSHKYAASQLELNYKRAFTICDRLMIWPFENIKEKPFGGAILHLESGAAFGDGNHPTTRLSLKALDFALQSIKDQSVLCEMAALDIGTGSGVLAIAAVLLGVGRALGLDTDPAACHEAMHNVLRNSLEGKVHISNQPLEQFSNQTFGLILANLRPPTLRKLFPLMRRVTEPRGIWVLSGFRPEEKNSLFANLHESEFLFWMGEEHNWAAAAVSVGAGV
jgi:ribosomal protein L11 methyltransferase